MPASAPRPSREQPSPEEIRPNSEAARPSSFAAVPGWMVSGMLHAGVIVFLVTSGLPSCGDGQLGTGAEEGEFRDVGIYVKQTPKPQNQPEKNDAEETQDNPAAKTSASKADQAKAAEADETASELLDLPKVKKRAVIGQSRGGPSEIGTPSSAKALVQPNAVRTPKAKGQGPGEVTFMGQSAPAQSVVYVIDTSSSMRKNQAMDYAKARLKQSINGLSPKQQFQIVAYTHVATAMRLRNEGSGDPSLYRAIGPNLTLATHFINGMSGKGGTKHKKALLEAFKFRPDVIFMLSDAEIDSLSPGELSDIKNRWNKHGKTHIHCIKFGRGPDLKPASKNFLRTLADQNLGSYSYLDVSKLEGP